MALPTNNEKNFENIKFNPFDYHKNILENDNDPDFNIFNENLQKLDTPYILPEEAANVCDNLRADSFSIFHVNIRSLNKNFENLKFLLSKIKFPFKLICLTETWCINKYFQNNSNFQLFNYTAVHQ